MNPRRRTLLSPLHCAAYLTWATVFVGLMAGGFTRGAVGDARDRASTAVLMLAFLASFLVAVRREARCGAPPLSALVAQAVVTLTLVAWTHDMLAAVMLIIVVAQAVDLAPARMIGLVAAANAGLLAVLFTVWSSPGTVMLVFLMYAGFQMFAGLTGYYAKEAERSRDELAEVNAHLLATRSLLEESARDGERLRLARELHDVSGHKLTALKLQLALLARDPAGAPDAVATSAALAGELLDDLRGVVGQLRQHDGLDLQRAIEELAAPMPRPQVHIHIAEEARVDDVEQAQALLRTAQEALTNAARHAAAGHVWITLVREKGRIVLDVRDDGRGSASIRPGHGLTGMRERLEAVGGGLALAGDAGFRIHAWVPSA